MLEVEATSDLRLSDGRELAIANYSTVGTGEIANDPQVQRLARDLSSWVEKARTGGSRGMFERQFYVAPGTPYQQMRVARHAAIDDDIVSGVLDSSQALAFDGGLKWESSNPNDADVFNQLSADVNLDDKIRQMWRDAGTIDQFVIAKLWGNKTYTARGVTSNGHKKKKTYNVWVPTDLMLLDSQYIVPIGTGPLRRDRLAWNGTRDMARSFDILQKDPTRDPLMAAFFLSRYKPDLNEESEMRKWGIDPTDLIELNPQWVFRHCTTKQDYQKFPDIRMRSVFNLLDQKRQLMASDRAMLVGAANYILLIRKGTDDQPGTEDEIANLKQNYQFLAKLPVIISDHRLNIEVVAPKLDFVLKPEAYDTIDSRILARMLSTFVSPGRGGSDAAVSTFTDVMASGIQDRRHMIKRTLEREISRAVVEHPRNAGIFEQRPSLVFTPRTVAVGLDQGTLSAMLSMRTQREISRDTILEYLGLDQATEAQRLTVEEELYDQIFKTRIPFSADNTATPNETPEAPANSGRRGGRPPGGGTTPQSPKRQARPRTNDGNATKDQG